MNKRVLIGVVVAVVLIALAALGLILGGDSDGLSPEATDSEPQLAQDQKQAEQPRLNSVKHGPAGEAALDVADKAKDSGKAIKGVGSAIKDVAKSEGTVRDVGHSAKGVGESAKDVGKSIKGGAKKTFEGVKKLF